MENATGINFYVAQDVRTDLRADENVFMELLENLADVGFSD